MVILGGWFIIGFTTLWQILIHQQPLKKRVNLEDKNSMRKHEQLLYCD